MGRMNWTDWTDTFLLALDVFGVNPERFFSLEQAYTLEPILKKYTQRIPTCGQRFDSSCRSYNHDRVVFLDDQGHYQRKMITCCADTAHRR